MVQNAVTYGTLQLIDLHQLPMTTKTAFKSLLNKLSHTSLFSFTTTVHLAAKLSNKRDFYLLGGEMSYKMPSEQGHPSLASDLSPHLLLKLKC